MMSCLAKAVGEREAIEAAMSLGLNVLDGASDYYENAAIICWLNDWEARDQRARIERTFDSCRFGRRKSIWGITTGRFFCCYKQVACQLLGNPLDGASLDYGPMLDLSDFEDYDESYYDDSYTS